MALERFVLTFAHDDARRNFATPEEAGRAFAAAAAARGPSVILSRGRSARTLARTVRIGERIAKSVPAPGRAETDHAFWAAYHEVAGLCDA